jgi:hypothetical protein
MVWDILLQIGASILLGAAVGYGVATIIDALSRAFANLWEGFVDSAKQIWGYVTEATQHLLALIAQWMDQSWSDIEDYLRQEIGYRREWLVAVFAEEREMFVAFIDSSNSQGNSAIYSMGIVESGNDIQLPTNQNPVVHKLII